jgi:myosin heavy subunit
MFSDEELNDILRLLSAVLHLGNLKFQGKIIKMINLNKSIFILATTTQNMDTCTVANPNVLRVISKLLKVIIKFLFALFFISMIIIFKA